MSRKAIALERQIKRTNIALERIVKVNKEVLKSWLGKEGEGKK